MKITNILKFLPKVAAIGLLMFTMNGYAGYWGNLFNSNYDPYYGLDRVQPSKCYRPCIRNVDTCACVKTGIKQKYGKYTKDGRYVKYTKNGKKYYAKKCKCSCLRSVTVFDRKYPDSPYSPMSNYYTNWFTGNF